MPVPRQLPSRRQLFGVAAAAAALLFGGLVWYSYVYLPQRAERLAAARGSIVVKTEPVGATVKVDDALPQIAPAVFSELKLGPHAVQIQHDGYEPKNLSAEVRENQSTDLGTIMLVRSKGSLKITTNPESLTYELRSESSPFQPMSGTTPMELKELDTGKYEVKVTRKGWPPQTRTCIVARGVLRPVFFDFSGGDITITSTPPGATVLRDNEQIGVTPLPIQNHPPGEVKYTLTLAGYENASIHGNVQAGQPLTLSESLKKTRPRTVQSSRRRRNGAAPRTNGESDERSERIKRAFIPYYDVFKP
jgi:hypothetical protein